MLQEAIAPVQNKKNEQVTLDREQKKVFLFCLFRNDYYTMNGTTLTLTACMFAGSLCLSSCSSQQKKAVEAEVTEVTVPVEEMTGFFEDTGGIPAHLMKWEDEPSLPGRLLIVVDKKKQMLYVYRGTTRVAYSPVSTGKSSGYTPAGYYQISDKEQEHRSYYGEFVHEDGTKRDGDIRKDSKRKGETFMPAEMPFFLRVCGPVGLHEGYLPGQPSSHGCIRLPHDIAEKLFEVADVGSLVVVSDGKWNIESLQKKPSSAFVKVKTAVPLKKSDHAHRRPASVKKAEAKDHDHSVNPSMTECSPSPVLPNSSDQEVTVPAASTPE